MQQIGIRLGLIVAIATFIVAGWYFLTPVFFNSFVDEPLPAGFPAKEEVGMILPPQSTIAEMVAARLMGRPLEVTQATATGGAIMSAVKNAPSHPTPAATSTVATTAAAIVAQGRFVDGDALHQGTGVATLYRAGDGSYLLRFEEFAATNGPDLHVVLSPNRTPLDHAGLGEFLDLGALKGNSGDQNYALPAEFDPTAYHSVVIYCLPFRVIFATATLHFAP